MTLSYSMKFPKAKSRLGQRLWDFWVEPTVIQRAPELAKGHNLIKTRTEVSLSFAGLTENETQRDWTMLWSCQWTSSTVSTWEWVSPLQPLWLISCPQTSNLKSENTTGVFHTWCGSWCDSLVSSHGFSTASSSMDSVDSPGLFTNCGSIPSWFGGHLPLWSNAQTFWKLIWVIMHQLGERKLWFSLKNLC